MKETAKRFLSFLQSFLEPPDAVFALHDFRVQIRWRKLAIPSLRSLRGFESLSGSPPKVFSVGLFQAPENTSSRGVFSRPVWGHDPPRALRAFGAAEMTLRTPHWTRSALRATIAIPSLRSLPRYNPKQMGHCPPQHTPSKSPKHRNILRIFSPRISLAVSPSQFDSQIQPISILCRFSALFPAFRTACFCLHLRIRTMTRNVLYQIRFHACISSIPKLFRYS